MPYITTDNLKELGYKWDASLNTDISEMCITASLMVDSFIQRVLPGKSSLEENDIEETVTVRVQGGMLKFFPKYYKVNSIESVVVWVDQFTNLEVKADNFKIISSTGMVTARVLVSNGEYYATVKYNAGFVADPIAGTTTLPVEIKKSTILIAQSLMSEYFMVKNFNISMLTQFKQGNLQFQRSSKLLNQSIPSSAQLLLAEYRRVR